MKSSVLLWLGRQVRSLGAHERVLVTKGMAQGKLGAQGITHEVWRSLRRWTLGDWVVSTLIFLVLMSLTMTKTWGGLSLAGGGSTSERSYAFTHPGANLMERNPAQRWG